MRSTILLSFLISYSFIYLTLVVSAKCLQDQQSLLLQLKNNLTFLPQVSTKLILWNENTPCCNWSRVTCDNEGHVIGLDLSGEGIYGGFDNSSSLFSLQYLQKLNLAYNYFDSSIPSGFGKLVMLNYLNWSNSYDVGNIPMEISKLTRLVTLDLASQDSFSKEQRRTIYNRNLQTFLQNLTSLRQLYLNDINISGMGKEWGNALLPLRDLQELSCSYCDLSGPLDSSLTKLVNLSILILSGNNLSGQIPYSLSNLTHLSILILNGNNLSGRIPSFLFTLPAVKVIMLSSNKFSKFDKFINVSSSVLEILYAHSNNLVGPFPTPIFKIHSLSYLDLSFNMFNGSLQLDKILKLRNLTHLNLSHNNISNHVNVSNVDFSSIPNFRYLGLASCNLNIFPKFLINQSRLFGLDLSNNQIQGEIPNWIWNLQHLEFFNISHNFLSNLEKPFQNLTSKLEILDLHNNKLQGSIPAFPQCAYTLDYSNNNFSIVPQDIGNYLFRTKFLSFSKNNLQGSIPVSLCNASQLQVLDISFNNFSGTIPPCLITMTNTLEVLNIKANNLTGPIPDMFPTYGPIPDMFPNYCVVARLNFHGNQLQGPIPMSLSHCSSLELLDIGSNQIVDHFPCFLNNIPTLSVLVLRNNHFHGSMECSENKPWKSIQIVDIAFNNGLTGEIPSSIGNMKQLESLDFSNNSLDGEIPVQLASLSFLSYLNLSFNHLVGKIPTGTQLQTFSASSFEGNHGLYGPPLNNISDGITKDMPSQPACEKLVCSIDWNFLSLELGFVFGIGMIIGPIMFWKKWRVRYWKFGDKVLCRIFPSMHLEYATDGGKMYTVLRW